MMKIYELSYLISPALPEEEIKSVQEKVNNYIVDLQGTLERIEDTSQKRPGLMATVSFCIRPEKIQDLWSKLKVEEKISNFMILNKKPRKIPDAPRRRPLFVPTETSLKSPEKINPITNKSKKVEIREIEQKLEEILGE